MLEEIVTHGNRGHIGFLDTNQIHCADGFSVSVIAGGGTYCSPRPTLCLCALGKGPYVPLFNDETAHDYPGPYNTVEVGYPTTTPEPWNEWERYAESPEKPTESVYGYVPVDMVRRLIATHGGESDD